MLLLLQPNKGCCILPMNFRRKTIQNETYFQAFWRFLIFGLTAENNSSDCYPTIAIKKVQYKSSRMR